MWYSGDFKALVLEHLQDYFLCIAYFSTKLKQFTGMSSSKLDVDVQLCLKSEVSTLQIKVKIAADVTNENDLFVQNG